jgi:hypothetical protein
MVGWISVDTGQLVWHSMYSLLYTPALNQRSLRVRLNLSVSQLCEASSFHFGVAPRFTPAPSLGIVPTTPESVMKCSVRVARPRTVNAPGRPRPLRLWR